MNKLLKRIIIKIKLEYRSIVRVYDLFSNQKELLWVFMNFIFTNKVVYMITYILLILAIRIMFNIDIIPIVKAEGLDLDTTRNILLEYDVRKGTITAEEANKYQEYIMKKRQENYNTAKVLEARLKMMEIWKIKEPNKDNYGLGPVVKERIQAEELIRKQQDQLQGKEKVKEIEIVASSSNSRAKVEKSSDIPITMLFPEDEVKLIQQRSHINTLTSDSSSSSTTPVQYSSSSNYNNTVNDITMSNSSPNKGKEKEVVASSSSSITKGELTELDRKALHEIKNNLYNSDSESETDVKDTKSDIVTDKKDTNMNLSLRYASKPEFKEKLLEKINEFNQLREDKEQEYYQSDNDNNNDNNSIIESTSITNNNITKTVTEVFPVDYTTVDVVTTDTTVENIARIHNNNNATDSSSITDNTTTIFNQSKLEDDNNKSTNTTTFPPTAPPMPPLPKAHIPSLTIFKEELLEKFNEFSQRKLEQFSEPTFVHAEVDSNDTPKVSSSSSITHSEINDIMSLDILKQIVETENIDNKVIITINQLQKLEHDMQLKRISLQENGELSDVVDTYIRSLLNDIYPEEDQNGVIDYTSSINYMKNLASSSNNKLLKIFIIQFDMSSYINAQLREDLDCDSNVIGNHINQLNNIIETDTMASRSSSIIKPEIANDNNNNNVSLDNNNNDDSDKEVNDNEDNDDTNKNNEDNRIDTDDNENSNDDNENSNDDNENSNDDNENSNDNNNADGNSEYNTDNDSTDNNDDNTDNVITTATLNFIQDVIEKEWFTDYEEPIRNSLQNLVDPLSALPVNWDYQKDNDIRTQFEHLLRDSENDISIRNLYLDYLLSHARSELKLSSEDLESVSEQLIDIIRKNFQNKTELTSEDMILEDLQNKYQNLSFNFGISEETKMLLEMQNRHLSSSSTTDSNVRHK
jgi:hypothetical protein